MGLSAAHTSGSFSDTGVNSLILKKKKKKPVYGNILACRPGDHGQIEGPGLVSHLWMWKKDDLDS